MREAAATIAVVPRETFSQVRDCLETLVANTKPPYRLVIVDGNSPRATRRWIETFAADHDATLIQADCLLTPNEARNAAIAVVDTEYVVILDDNCFVREGWLDALVSCAEETSAGIVGPICGIRTGRHSPATVHDFGGESHIVVDGARRELVERHLHSDTPIDHAIATLARTEAEVTEFHCMLVRRSLFDELGPLDERLLSSREHLDLCLLARAAGHEIWVEPAAVTVFERPVPLPWRDRPFYILRWSDAWNDASLARFAEKWQLTDDESLATMLDFADDYRFIAYRLSPRLLDRAFRRLGRTRNAVDRLAQAVIVPRNTRRRASSHGPRIVRAAGWQDRRTLVN